MLSFFLAYEHKHSSSDDEDGDFKDIPFPQDSSNTAQVSNTGLEFE